MKLFSLLLLILMLALTGCSSIDRKDDDSYKQLSESTTFPMDYTGKPATLPPETWAEFYDAGTYLYGIGKYEKAMDYFLSAANLASGEARRICLVAAAISALAASDSTQFLSIRQEIKGITEDDPFKQPTVTDRALEALEKIDRY
jgi:hypothetical protein